MTRRHAQVSQTRKRVISDDESNSENPGSDSSNEAVVDRQFYDSDESLTDVAVDSEDLDDDSEADTTIEEDNGNSDEESLRRNSIEKLASGNRRSKRSKNTGSKSGEMSLEEEEQEFLEEWENDFEVKTTLKSSSRQRSKRRPVEFDFQHLDQVLSEQGPTRKKMKAEEMALARMEKARRRRQQKIEKEERETRETLQKLLKKQAPKKLKKDVDDEDVLEPTESGRKRYIAPKNSTRYVQTQKSATLSFPSGYKDSFIEC